MSGRLKVTISLKEDLYREIEDTCRATKRSRSAVFEEAILTWKKRRLEEDLKKGYKAMAGIDQETAEKNLEAGAEVWDE